MAYLRRLLVSSRYETSIYILLLSYALLLVVRPDTGSWWYTEYQLLYTTIIALLVADVVLRVLLVRPTTWFSEQGVWLAFDIVTTVVAFIPGYEPFRAARVLRILSQWHETRSTITPLGVAVWEARRALVIVAVLMFVNTVIGYDAFKLALPELFGSAPGALLTSVSLVIGDNFRDTYAAAFAVHAPAALFHLCVSLFTLLFILSLIIYKVFKSFDDAQDV